MNSENREKDFGEFRGGARMRKIAVGDKDLVFIKSVFLRHLGSRASLRLYAYGSRVDGSHSPSSDLDLLVFSEREVELSSLAFIREELEESDLSFCVDILDAASVDSLLREKILCGAVEF